MSSKKPRTKKAVSEKESEESTNGPKEIKKPKKKRKLRYILLYLAAIGFVFYAVITIISQNVKIAEKKSELNELHQHIKVVEKDSEELEIVRGLKGTERSKYMEKKAKENGYVGDGERIFINE